MNLNYTYRFKFLIRIEKELNTEEETVNSLFQFKCSFRFFSNNKSIAVYSNEQIFIDHSNNLLVLLKGSLYEPDDIKKIISEYIKNPNKFFETFNGQFLTVLIDIANEKFFIVSDRFNTYKLFHLEKNTLKYFSNDINLLKTIDDSLDKRALIWFITTGFPINNRTLYKNIKIFPPASIFVLDKYSEKIKKYWVLSYQFALDTDISNLKSELYKLIVYSVAKRSKEYTAYFVSLSGGYDISAILAIMQKELDLRNVSTLSYYYKDVIKGSDAFVAKQQADFCNYKHLSIPSYDGDLMNSILLNAQIGKGITNFCSEIDFWIYIENLIEDKANAVFFFGEEIFGWRKHNIHNLEDILRVLHINTLDNLSKSNAQKLLKDLNVDFDILDQDINDLQTKFDGLNSKYDAINIFYYDLRLSNIMSSWREYFPGEFTNIENPLLDYSIVDFLSQIHPKHRYNKSLFIKTMKYFHQDLFTTIKRAKTSNSSPNWATIIKSNSESIKNTLKGDFFLDQFIYSNLIELEKGKQKSNTISKPINKLINLYFSNLLPRFINQIPLTDIIIRSLVLKKVLGNNAQY